MGPQTMTDAVPAWRRLARRGATTPGIRLLAPGWPDAGRRIVQLPALAALLRQAARAAAPVRRVVNAGVGEGLHSPLIHHFAPAATLIEFDLSNPPRGHWPATRFVASVTAIPLPSASVDLVVCTEVLEHVADHEQAVAELRRVLTPGGSLVLSVPTPPAVFDPAHVREGYTLPDLTAIFTRHGLEVTATRYCMHALFKAVLRYWRPQRVPLGAILGAAWLDRVVRLGAPMDLVVLARPHAASRISPC